MYSRIKIAGHPVHPMLTAFPIAFYTSTLMCYIVYACTTNYFWLKVGVFANIAGVCTGALAAFPGFIDWLAIPNQVPAKTTGIVHMTLNTSALLLYTISAVIEFIRLRDVAPDCTLAIILSSLGFIATLAAGFFGWKMVQTHHVGVELSPEQEKLEPINRKLDSNESLN